MKNGNRQFILDKLAAAGVGPVVAFAGDGRCGLAVSVSGAGTVSATVKIEVADDPTQGWNSDGECTITVSGTGTATDYLQSTEPWRYIRATVIALSAGAVVSVVAGDELSGGTGITRVGGFVKASINPVTGGSVFSTTIIEESASTLLSKYKKFGAAIGKMRAGAGNARVLLIGDSTTAGYGGGNAVFGADGQKYTLAPKIAAMLDVGTWPAYAENWLGLSSLAPSQFAAYDPRVAYTAGWDSLGISSSFPGSYGFRNTSGSTPLSFTPRRACNTWEVIYKTLNGGGTITLDVDGGAVLATVNTGAPDSVQKVKVTATGTTLNIKRSAGAGWILILGVTATNETAGNVIDVCQSGVSGCKADYYTLSTNQVTDYVNIVSVYAPHLVIVSLTINDWSNSTPIETYKAQIQAIVTASVAAGADVVLRVSRPSAISSVPFARQLEYRAAIYALAASNGCFVDDVFCRVESYESQTANGVYLDALHPNSAGYALEAGAIAEFIRRF